MASKPKETKVESKIESKVETKATPTTVANPPTGEKKKAKKAASTAGVGGAKKPKPAAGSKKPKKSKKLKATVVTLNCAIPLKDRILDLDNFVDFVKNKFKVDGKTMKLGDKVRIEKGLNDDLKITSTLKYQKRYVKYLAKKYLKKNSLRDWLHVVSTGKDTYQLKYFQITQAEGAEEATNADAAEKK